jgi:hypothetical protein
MLFSLDGVAEAPDSFFGWDDAIDAKTAALIATHLPLSWVTFQPK